MLHFLRCVQLRDLRVLRVNHRLNAQVSSGRRERLLRENCGYMKKTKTSKSEKRKELAALAAMPDERIDFSDIPELTERHFRNAKRGRFYRPVKKPVTMRPDAT